MPHTSHRKKKDPQNKRREILGDDGWTQITSISSTTRQPTATSWLIPNGSDSLPSKDCHLVIDDRHAIAAPMPPTRGSRLETMQAQFSRIEAKWLGTEICKALEHVLIDGILTAGRQTSNCVVFGTGSFCGNAVHWIDRHESAYFQLAAFKTVVNTIEKVQGRPLPAYAQEPYYNDLDNAFLASLNITKVNHPQGFELLDEHSFAYSPAAEPDVELQIMARNPQIWLHRTFDYSLRENEAAKASSTMAEEFKKACEHTQLPALDLKNFPFHGSVIWWRKHDSLQDNLEDL